MTDVFLIGSVGLIAVAFAAAVAVAIPAIRQFQRTSARVERLAIRLEKEMDPLLARARYVLDDLERNAASWDQLTGRLDRALGIIDRLGVLLSGLRYAIGRTAGRRATAAVAAVAAARRGLRYLRRMSA